MISPFTGPISSLRKGLQTKFRKRYEDNYVKHQLGKDEGVRIANKTARHLSDEAWNARVVAEMCRACEAEARRFIAREMWVEEQRKAEKKKQTLMFDSVPKSPSRRQPKEVSR